MDLEIAVNPCLAETQNLHDILSLSGGSSRLHRPPIHGIAVFYSKGLATRGERAWVTCVPLFTGVCRHPRFRVRLEGVTKTSHGVVAVVSSQTSISRESPEYVASRRRHGCRSQHDEKVTKNPFQYRPMVVEKDPFECTKGGKP
jgi:hypothetical protein